MTCEDFCSRCGKHRRLSLFARLGPPKADLSWLRWLALLGLLVSIYLNPGLVRPKVREWLNPTPPDTPTLQGKLPFGKSDFNVGNVKWLDIQGGRFIVGEITNRTADGSSPLFVRFGLLDVDGTEIGLATAEVANPGPFETAIFQAPVQRAGAASFKLVDYGKVR